MASEASFSERQGYVRPREIIYRDGLPKKLRQPMINILRRSFNAAFLWERIERLLNPYGIEDWPAPAGPITILKEEDNPTFIRAKRVLLACPWFRIYELIEDLYGQLYFHDTELLNQEECQSYPFQQSLNEYFEYAGIGWKLTGGKIVARGDDAFERTVHIAEAELRDGARTTAAERIENAIRNLSLRPKPDLSGAISHATGAMECVLHDITQQSMTLGDYIKKRPDLFPGAMKSAFASIWGYASEEGARHGKEGVEPPREEAEFIVSLAAALTTYLNRKHPRP
jgi:hypothetical protein